jgi:hypothetical protein
MLKANLTVRAAPDPRRHDKRIPAELAHLRSTPAKLHGNWNYFTTPRPNNL